MVVKAKEKIEKTRNVKNNDKSKKKVFKDKEMQNIVMEFYLIKRNVKISRHSSVQKGIWHQSQRITSSSDTNQSSNSTSKSQKYKS